MALTDSLPHGRRLRPALTRLAAAVALALGTVAAGQAADAHAVRTVADVPYLGENGPLLDVHRRAGATRPAPAVMVVHGGSWRSGSKRRMSAISRAIAGQGFVVFNVGYRLVTPDRPGLRRQQDDLRAAVRWIRANARRFHVDPRRVGALGSSAGGHLVSLLATRGTGPVTEGARLRAAVTWSAPFDLSPLRPLWLGGAVENLLGCIASDCAAERAEASPVEHVSPDDPSMLIANSRDEVIPSSQALAMADRLAAAGVEHRMRMLPGSRHGIEYARAMLPATVAFLERVLRPRGLR